MATICDEIAAQLVMESGYTIGTDLFKEKVPNEDSMLAILEDPGNGAEPMAGTGSAGVVYIDQRVRFVLRGAKGTKAVVESAAATLVGNWRNRGAFRLPAVGGSRYLKTYMVQEPLTVFEGIQERPQVEWVVGFWRTPA